MCPIDHRLLRTAPGSSPTWGAEVDIVTNYALHLVAAGLLLFVFFLVYTWATPFDEMTLIRQGNVAAALTLGGAMIGFSMTVASGLVHTDALASFIAWSAAAAAIQLFTYVLVSRLLHMSKQQIEGNNVAFGVLLASISVAVGAVSAGALS
jgi:putative membrane protein